MGKFYVLHYEDVGPNAEPLNDYVTIEPEPGITNSSKEIRLNGWLGTTNDCSVHAHGEFDTIESAREYIAEEWPNLKIWEEHSDDTFYAEDYLERYSDPREVWDVADWLNDSTKVTSDMTDDELREMEDEIESDAKNQNIYLKGDVFEYLKRKRDEKIGEVA